MGNDLHILYADDDDDDAYLFREVLRDLGLTCRISIYPSGVALIEQLAGMTQMPDLVFMDINMPYRNGFECLGEIRKNNDWDGIPIYLISTADQQEYTQRAISLGALGYINKPSSYDQLKNVLGATIFNILPGIMAQ